MKLFNRNKDQSNSDDIQNYYATERRERTGVAWLLAAGTLIVTLLLALGFFYGGRWAYRAIFDDNDTSQIANDGEVQEDAVSPFDDGDDATEEGGADDGDSIDEAPSSNNDPLSDDASGGDSTDSTASASDDEETEPALPVSGTLPSTGPSEPEL